MSIRVLMVGWEYPPHYSGGLGIVCRSLSEALVDEGCQVLFTLPNGLKVPKSKVEFVYCEPKGELHDVTTELYRELTNPYLDEVTYALLREKYKDLPLHLPTSMNARVELYAHLLKAVLKKKKPKVDLIHAHDWLSFPAGLAAKEVLKKPLVVQVHATEFDRGAGLGVSQTIYDKEREGMHKADHVIAVSGWTKNIIVSKYDLPPAKVSVLHNALSVEELHDGNGSLEKFAKDRQIVSFIGRVTLQKGPKFFLDAAAIVAKHNDKASFIIAGNGHLTHEMMDYAAKLGIAKRCYFTDKQYTLDEASELYRISDVFILPSVSEPFGVTALEAAALGTPTIVSKQSGCAEALTHSLKVDFWDVEEMANMTLSLLAYKPLHATLSKEAKVQARSMTWSDRARELKSIYSHVLSLVS